MPARSDTAFVLARYPYRERDHVVALLTRTGGQVRLLARRSRGARSSAASALEPLNLVELSYFEKPGRELGTLEQVHLLRSAFPLASRPVAWAAAQLVGELALVFCPPGQAVEASFRLVDHCVDSLLAGADPALVAAYAELWFVRLAGVLPELDRCVVCGVDLAEARQAVYDAGESGLVCAAHAAVAGAFRLDPAALAWLRRALHAPLQRVAGSRPPPAAVAWLEGLQRRFSEREPASRRLLRRLLEEG